MINNRTVSSGEKPQQLREQRIYFDMNNGQMQFIMPIINISSPGLFHIISTGNILSMNMDLRVLLVNVYQGKRHVLNVSNIVHISGIFSINTTEYILEGTVSLFLQKISQSSGNVIIRGSNTSIIRY